MTQQSVAAAARDWTAEQCANRTPDCGMIPVGICRKTFAEDPIWDCLLRSPARELDRGTPSVTWVWEQEIRFYPDADDNPYFRFKSPRWKTITDQETGQTYTEFTSRSH